MIYYLLHDVSRKKNGGRLASTKEEIVQQTCWETTCPVWWPLHEVRDISVSG